MSARDAQHGLGPRVRAFACVIGGGAGVALACWLGARGVEPAATWLYPFAWYPLLVALEGAVALRHGRFLVLDRPRTVLSLLAWSVPAWMLWEVLNFRVENWYYVFVPERRAALWTGVVVSFATVLPACFVPAALFLPRRGGREDAGPGGAAGGSGARRGASSSSSGSGSEATVADGEASGAAAAPVPAVRASLALAGVLMLLLPLVWPRIFFPLIWGGVFFLAEADTAGRAPGRSLVADVLRRRAGRVGALLAGGALAGLAWEGLNVVARGRWIYTVPWLEQVKLFEMPPLGFLGFPALALSCFALYQWLAVRGWARPLDLDDLLADGPPWASAPGAGAGRAPSEAPTSGPGRPDGVAAPAADRSRVPAGYGHPGRRWAGALAVLLVVGTLLGMERWTISSRTPRLRGLPGLLPGQVETLLAWGVDSPFELATRAPGSLAARLPGVEEEAAARWIATARLATTRGLGARNARLLHRWEVRDLQALAAADTAALSRCFRRAGVNDVRPAQVRVWWRAARRRAGSGVDGDARPRC